MMGFKIRFTIEFKPCSHFLNRQVVANGCHGILERFSFLGMHQRFTTRHQGDAFFNAQCEPSPEIKLFSTVKLVIDPNPQAILE